jgi:hypothetical protein
MFDEEEPYPEQVGGLALFSLLPMALNSLLGSNLS